MRGAFELAWANSYVHIKSRPTIECMDDINFQKPVEVGSLLYLSSQVRLSSKTNWIVGPGLSSTSFLPSPKFLKRKTTPRIFISTNSVHSLTEALEVVSLFDRTSKLLTKNSNWLFDQWELVLLHSEKGKQLCFCASLCPCPAVRQLLLNIR